MNWGSGWGSQRFVLVILASIGLQFKSAAASECIHLLERLRESKEMQPVEVHGVLFHNKALAEIFREGFTPEALEKATRLLIDHQAFEIKIDENGFVVASDSRGSYATAVWTRDLFRVARGLIAMNRKIDAKRVILAGLNGMSTPKQLQRYYTNLRDPSLHMNSPESKLMVPHIRFDPKTLDDVMIPGPDGHYYPQGWNHKQNDALALMALVTIEALHLGIVEWKDFSDAQKAALAANMAYFVRLRAWDMWDGGAWEEASARRTSSVALVTAALEIFQDGRTNADFISRFDQNPIFPDDIKRIIFESLSTERVREAVEGGYQTIDHQLELGEAPFYWDPNATQGQRFADAALVHMAWYPLKRLTEAQYQMILKHIDALKRPGGTLRYMDDGYLNASYFFEDSDVFPKDMQHPQSAASTYTGADMRRASDMRDADFLKYVLGPDFEAQWTLADIIRIELLGQMIEKFQSSPNRVVYEKDIREMALRMFGFVTGASEGGHGPYAIDGIRVGAWKWSEAAIPVRDYGSSPANPKTYYAFSRFTPLFWPTGESAIAIQRLYQIFKGTGAPFTENAQ